MQEEKEKIAWRDDFYVVYVGFRVYVRVDTRPKLPSAPVGGKERGGVQRGMDCLNRKWNLRSTLTFTQKDSNECPSKPSCVFRL